MKASHRGSCSVSVCPIAYPSVHTFSLANIHCNESLVRFDISGFRDNINIGTSSLDPGYAVVSLRHGAPASLPYPHQKALLFSISPSGPPNANISKKQSGSPVLVPYSQFTCTHASSAHSTVLPSLGNHFPKCCSVHGSAICHFFCSQTLWADSLVSWSSRSALLHCLCKVLDQLS